MTDEIYEIEDIIPIDYQKYLESTMLGWNFPWVFNKSLVSPDETFQGRKDNHSGFMHFLYENGKPDSHFFNLIYPLVLSITSKSPVKFNNLVRMRAVLTLPNASTDLDHHMPHIDSWSPHWNAIYYVNDADGDTFIFNETNENYDSGLSDIKKIQEGKFTIKRRITPKRGKILIFPGKYYHTSSFCKDYPYRCIININLESFRDMIPNE